MTRYFAFLRGINVGGHKVVSMADLSRAFESLGLSAVKTHIQSGNVVFETARSSRAALVKQIGGALNDLIGSDVALFLRNTAELEALAARDPFEGANAEPEDRLYVTFLPAPPRHVPALPHWSASKDVEIIEVRGADVFSIGHNSNGRYGFPNAVVEKLFAVQATTRNWRTIVKLLA
jgi:uncharacterized protein (DUF1697 family)